MPTENTSLMVDTRGPGHSGWKSSASVVAAKGTSKHGVQIKILIADQEGVFRLGLKKLFSVEDDLRVVAQAESSSQLLAMARSFKPDLMVIQDEIVLRGCPSPLEQIHREWPQCRVVVTGSKLTDGDSESLLHEGASGVIDRSAPTGVFLENVRKVIKGGMALYPKQAGQTPGNVRSQTDSKPRPVDTLTRRERTIISCLTQGWRNREIAEHLTITEQTVKNHLRSVYDKVGVSDRLELVLYAIHQRMDLPPLDSYT